ncbi:hypothetical protein M758_8G099200 [Ceratodon purpureus]|nr:hypothetical protein M758_8G099200 [Ceratodon purpureus]
MEYKPSSNFSICVINGEICSAKFTFKPEVCLATQIRSPSSTTMAHKPVCSFRSLLSAWSVPTNRINDVNHGYAFHTIL